MGCCQSKKDEPLDPHEEETTVEKEVPKPVKKKEKGRSVEDVNSAAELDGGELKTSRSSETLNSDVPFYMDHDKRSLSDYEPNLPAAPVVAQQMEYLSTSFKPKKLPMAAVYQSPSYNRPSTEGRAEPVRVMSAPSLSTAKFPHRPDPDEVPEIEIESDWSDDEDELKTSRRSTRSLHIMQRLKPPPPPKVEVK